MSRAHSSAKDLCRVLGVFAKKPEPGCVKTRLASATSPTWAAQVALAFLWDTLDRVARVRARLVVAYAPADAEPFFADLARGRADLVAQDDGDLGQRMAAFFSAQLAAGAERVVLIGADSPTLPCEIVEGAFALLDSADVVLGPAHDGGYYLLGCARRLPAIFAGISWGTHSVLEQTIARLADPGWRVALLPPWYDVDSVNDWRMLRGHVAAQRRAGLDPGIPETEKLLHCFASEEPP